MPLTVNVCITTQEKINKREKRLQPIHSHHISQEAYICENTFT